MASQDPQPTTPQLIAHVIHGVLRGAAVAFLALAIYVALTNWDGGGDVWALRYAVLAVALYLASSGLRSLLSRKD